MKITAELIRRGAVMLKEACPICSGIQIRYRGKTYCTNHEDLTSLLTGEEITYSSVTDSLRELLVGKLKESIDSLQNEKDLQKQDAIVSLIGKYIELINKLPQPS